MICMLFQMVVKKGNLLSYPTNAHLGSLNTSFIPKTKSTRYNDYFYYINKHKMGSQKPTNEFTKILFTGMRAQNNVSIFCNFQFAVLPLTASDFTKEIYDVRFYNKIIKEQQSKISNLETELSSIKLSLDPVYYYGPSSHNNEQKLNLNKRLKLSFQGQTSNSFLQITNGYDSNDLGYTTYLSWMVLKQLKEYYKVYHKKAWGIKQAYKSYKMKKY